MKSAALKSAIAIIWPPVLQKVKIMNGRNQIKKIQHKASGFVLSYLTLEKLSRDKKSVPSVLKLLIINVWVMALCLRKLYGCEKILR